MMRVSFPVMALCVLAGCATIAEMARGAVQPPQAPVSPSPDLFGSVALKLGHNRYSNRWSRVALSGDAAELGGLVQPARALPLDGQAAFVNAALNQRIRYRFDSDPSGDRWATARETLKQRAGDCEDYVIAKMHALRRLGARPGDLFMTIGHDEAAGMAHAVLVVRAKGGLVVLDNRTDRVIPEQQYRGFYPILSFSAAGEAWLHGYRRGQTPAAVRMMSQRFAQGQHLQLGSAEGSRRRLGL